MSDAKHRIGISEEWYLFIPPGGALPQLYRTARTVWPLSAKEVQLTESQAQSGNPCALNNLGRPLDRVLRVRLNHSQTFSVLFTGAVHLFGWGKRPVDRYKAYDCFCRAQIAGSAAATNNRAVCKYVEFGCAKRTHEASSDLHDLMETRGIPFPLLLITMVWVHFSSFPLSALFVSSQGFCNLWLRSTLA
jgi:hypothetical protein